VNTIKDMTVLEASLDLGVPVDVLLALKATLALHVPVVGGREVWTQEARLKVLGHLGAEQIKAKIATANKGRREATLRSHPNYEFMYAVENEYTRSQKPTKNVGELDHIITSTKG